MSFRLAKAREANAERLQTLATRWRDRAWGPHVDQAEHRNGWAEHLKRVAEDIATGKAEQEA
jgi:hypothetical protein